MKKIKNLVPFKFPIQKNAKDNKIEKKGLKYLINGQKEQKGKKNENENYEEEFTPKFNGNNPLVKNGNIKMKKLYMEIEENPLKSVANKICNLKKDKNENKNNYIDDYEIIDSDLNYKENIEFENDDINGSDFTEGEVQDGKEQCEENGFEEIGYFNNFEEEELEELDQEKDEEQGENDNDGEKSNDKNNEEDELVNYDNRNIIKNKYDDNKKYNKKKKKENIIKEQNNKKIIKQDNKDNKKKEETNFEIIKKQENKIKIQKAQSFLQPNSIPQKLKKMSKTKKIQLEEISKNDFDSKSYEEKFDNKIENNSILKDLDNKKEKQNILTNKSNILTQEKNDKNKSQSKIISKIKDKDKNKIGKNDTNASTFSRNKSLNSVKNNPMELILPEKSSNTRNKINEIHFLSPVRILNNKLRPFSSQNLLNNHQNKNTNNLTKIEKSHINELRENKETNKNIKEKKVYDISSNNNEIYRKMPIKKDEEKRNTNPQHLIMISSNKNYNSKDKDENTNMNINRTYNKNIANKYNNRYNNNILSRSEKINENEIENSGITHSIVYTNKKNKSESNTNCRPHSIIIINTSKEENKKIGREYLTSSSILNQSLGYNLRNNTKNNQSRNIGNEYQSNLKSINNNSNKTNLNNDDDINTNKSLNLTKGYKIEMNSPRQRANHTNNNVHTIYISPGSKINKDNKKEIKQKEIKHTNEIYYSSYFSNKKDSTKNDNSLCKSICSMNTSTFKSDKKKDIINKPIIHNTLVIKSKRGEIKDKPESNEKTSFKLNLNNITISSSNTTKRNIKSIEKNGIKDESSSKIGNKCHNSSKSNKNEKNDNTNISEFNINKEIKDNIKNDVKEEKKSEEINGNTTKEENVNNSAITSSKNKGTENKDLVITNSEFNVNEKKDEIGEIKEKTDTKKEDKSEMDLNNKFFNSNNNTEELTSTKEENKIENILSNDKKQEKIENKFDFLNFGSSFNIPSFNNTNSTTDNNLNINNENKKNEFEKIKEESIFDKYPFLSNPDLFDFTKEYLSLYNSATRHELSDYTKAYLNSLGTTTSTSTTRPELSNLTKAYLQENTIGFDDLENKGS
jgi:hypothetical protein